MSIAARLGLWRPARWIERARAALVLQDAAEARSLVERAIRRAPAWAEPFYLLSRCVELEGGPRTEEEALLQAALDRDPEHVAAERALLAIHGWRLEPLTHAWHLFHGGFTAMALDAFRTALGEVDSRLPVGSLPHVTAGIAWCHHAMARPDWAIEAFEEALASDPTIAHAEKGFGICLYQLKRYDEAEKHLGRAIELEPLFHDATAFLGWCAYERGRYVQAQGRFAEAVTAHASLADARWGLAWSEWQLGEVESALQCFAAAYECDTTHPSITDVEPWVMSDPRYAALSEAWSAIDARRAVEVARRVPRIAHGALLPALTSLVEGRPADCLRMLESLDSLAPSDAWRARLLEGRAQAALDNAEAALAAFANAASLAPGRAEPIVEATEFLRRMGRDQEAEELLRSAANGPGPPTPVPSRHDTLDSDIENEESRTT